MTPLNKFFPMSIWMHFKTHGVQQLFISYQFVLSDIRDEFARCDGYYSQ